MLFVLLLLVSCTLLVVLITLNLFFLPCQLLFITAFYLHLIFVFNQHPWVHKRHILATFVYSKLIRGQWVEGVPRLCLNLSSLLLVHSVEVNMFFSLYI